MLISVTEVGSVFKNRRYLAALSMLSAVLALSLLLAQHTDYSHAHENHEHEIECEICLAFGIGDELIIQDSATNSFHQTSNIQLPDSLASITSVVFEANSRGPPQA